MHLANSRFFGGGFVRGCLRQRSDSQNPLSSRQPRHCLGNSNCSGRDGTSGAGPEADASQGSARCLLDGSHELGSFGDGLRSRFSCWRGLRAVVGVGRGRSSSARRLLSRQIGDQLSTVASAKNSRARGALQRPPAPVTRAACTCGRPRLVLKRGSGGRVGFARCRGSRLITAGQGAWVNGVGGVPTLACTASRRC